MYEQASDDESERYRGQSFDIKREADTAGGSGGKDSS